MTRTWLVNSRWCNIYHSSNSTIIWPHWCRSTGEGLIWSTAACNRLCHASLLARVLKDFRLFSLHCSDFLVTYRHFARVFSLLCLRVFVLVFSRFPFLCVFILKFSEVRFRPRKGDSIHCTCLFLILLPHALWLCPPVGCVPCLSIFLTLNSVQVWVRPWNWESGVKRATVSPFLSGAFLLELAVACGNSAIVLVFDALVTLCLPELFSANALDTQHSTFGGAWKTLLGWFAEAQMV